MELSIFPIYLSISRNSPDRSSFNFPGQGRRGREFQSRNILLITGYLIARIKLIVNPCLRVARQWIIFFRESLRPILENRMKIAWHNENMKMIRSLIGWGGEEERWRKWNESCDKEVGNREIEERKKRGKVDTVRCEYNVKQTKKEKTDFSARSWKVRDN